MGPIVSTSDESIHLNEDYFSWDNWEEWLIYREIASLQLCTKSVNVIGVSPLIQALHFTEPIRSSPRLYVNHEIIRGFYSLH